MPDVDTLTGMTPAEMDALVLSMDIAERRQQAALALLSTRAEQAGTFLVDGHRTAKAWTQAACNWSGPQAARTVRLGRAFGLMPTFAAASLAGEIGISQMHAIAKVAANPRVREHLPGSEQLLVDQARILDHDEFMLMLRQWEQLADENGADRKHEHAHRNRRAAINLLDELTYLDAVGPAAQGVIMREILERFENGEFEAEWAQGVEQYGEGMHSSLLHRTAPQRRFDALFALFQAAAGSGKMGGDDVLVNVVIDQARAEREAARAAGLDVEPLDPSTVLDQHCETDRGDILHPADILAMMWIGQIRGITLRQDGVVTNAGRRRRLFTGEMRRLVLLSAIRCIWPGCDLPASKCDADHTHPYSQGGHTCTHNGGPACSRHNWLKQRGYTTTRNHNGTWTILRPDGTTIGWRNNTPHAGN